jgi:hypothetical protein
VLGVSEGAVRGLLRRARSSLRAAAGALTPQPLIARAADGLREAAPAGTRMLELSSPSGALGASWPLVRAAAIALTTAAIVVGARVGIHHHHGATAHPRTAATPARVAQGGGVASETASVSRSSASRSGARSASGTTGAGASPTSGRSAPRSAGGSPQSHVTPHTGSGSPGPGAEAVVPGGQPGGESTATTATTATSESAGATQTPPPAEAPKTESPELPLKESAKGDDGTSDDSAEREHTGTGSSETEKLDK